MSNAINLNTKRMQFPFVLKECLIWNFLWTLYLCISCFSDILLRKSIVRN